MNIKGLLVYMLFITASFFTSIIFLGLDVKYLLLYPVILLVTTLYYLTVHYTVQGDC